MSSDQSARAGEQAELAKSLLGPLAAFYVASGQPTPPARPIAAADLPPIYRRLLDHERDMTGTLEAYFGAPLRLVPISIRRSGSILIREVVLVTDAAETPVEFGAIRIDLDRLDAEARHLVIEGVRPLGAILTECAVPYRCELGAFFRVASDSITESAFRLREPAQLYGRRNVIYDGQDALLAEVAEILPPLEKYPESKDGVT